MELSRRHLPGSLTHHGKARGPSSSGRAVRVLVSADQELVAEAMAEALTARDLQAVRPGAAPAGEDADVGLLLSGLDGALALHHARQVIAAGSLSWVVATPTPPGAEWGAVLDAGAAVVVPTWIALPQLVSVLHDTAGGLRSPAGAERELLIGRWATPGAGSGRDADRVRALSGREHEVLRLLVAGETVLRIADLLSITEGTVRAHVKAMLRKLGVSSQLAAVALYRRLDDGEGGPRPPSVGAAVPDDSTDRAEHDAQVEAE